MNTNCADCYFSNFYSGCEFNIPELIRDDYKINKKNGYNYIENYKCSYAFSKNSFEKNKQNLPENMLEFVRQQNVLNYYLIVDCSKEISCEINSLPLIINDLNNIPQKLSIVTHVKKNILKDIIQYYKSNLSNNWKIHNLLSNNQTDKEKLFDILNVNTIKVDFVLYIHFKSISELQEDLNYINFLYNVKKPKYAAIRKNDIDLDGLCISSKNLTLIKREHSSEYINFLSNNDTIVKKYYE